MKRREFVGLAAAAAAWPFAARAQQVGGMRRLGVLAGYAANDPLGQMPATVLPQGLAALGWSDGQNIHLDWRWASGDPKLYESYAAELVALRPDALQSRFHAFRRSHSTGRARRPIVCSDGPLLSLPRRCGHRCLDETCS
jgi:hypothetical protein